VQGSAGNIRKQVDATLCAMCHGPAGPGNQFYQAGLSSTIDPDDGPALYDLACAACHKDLASSKVSGESAKDIQKKIDENEADMGPLRVLSTQEIQAIAAALAKPGEDDKDDDD
jgi:mono/diheme cytochrome c family protein